MRTITPLRNLALCVLVVSVAATGCADDGADAEASASWSALRETHAAEEEAEAVQAAEQAVRDYYQVRDQCLADPPNTDPSCFDEVSMDDQLTNDRNTLEYTQEEGLRVVGAIKVVGTERVVDIQLPVGHKEITLSMCLDTAGLDTIGPDSTSVKPEGDPRGRQLFIVRKHADKWKVANILDDPEGETC